MEWPLGCPHIRGRQSGERLVEAPDMIIDADGLTDGVTFALRGHLAPWKDLDIIRLSDVLKHMPLMGKRELGTEFDSYRAYAKTQGRQGFSQRIYASPVSHEENFNCSCVYCKYVCEETM